jgi:hypothetical protein
MLVKVFGSAVFGVEATTITVEVNIDKGIGYHLVGLPDNAIKESSLKLFFIFCRYSKDYICSFHISILYLYTFIIKQLKICF